jgi:hypothetical protein
LDLRGLLLEAGWEFQVLSATSLTALSAGSASAAVIGGPAVTAVASGSAIGGPAGSGSAVTAVACGSNTAHSAGSAITAVAAFPPFTTSSARNAQNVIYVSAIDACRCPVDISIK